MSEVKVTLNKKMIRDTSPPQDTPIYQIWDSYLGENRRYALDTIILVTQIWHETLRLPKINSHTK